MFKRNDSVQQKLPAPFAGQIAGFVADNETGATLAHVVNDAGDARYFKLDELEAAPGAKEAEVKAKK